MDILHPYVFHFDPDQTIEQATETAVLLDYYLNIGVQTAHVVPVIWCAGDYIRHMTTRN